MPQVRPRRGAVAKCVRLRFERRAVWPARVPRALPPRLRVCCTDGVSAVANAAWLSLRKIGSDAPRGRKTANQAALQNPQGPAQNWPDLARPRILSSART